jgi:hypothetical protein
LEKTLLETVSAPAYQTPAGAWNIVLIHMLLAAILFSLHHWVAIVKSGGDYSPFAASDQDSSLTFDETCCYAPFAGRFVWVGQLVAEVDNYERRHSSAGVPFVPAAVLGAMGRVLGNLERAFIAADFVFPALTLGLLYAASAGIVRSTWLRLSVAWTTLLIPFGPRNFLWYGSESMIAAPDFTRTPQPEISFPIVLAGVLLTPRGLRSSATRKAITAGLVGALIVGSYYFYAVGWSLTLGMLLLLAAAWRKWIDVKRVAVMLAVMIVASAPYIAATVRGTLEGSQTQLFSHIGGSAFTHTPSVIPLFVFAAGSFFVWKFGQKLVEGQEHGLRLLLLVLLLLAGFAGLNFQIFSGYEAAHDKHFWNRLIQPVGFFLAGCWSLVAAERRRQSPRRLNYIAAGLLALILLNAAARQLYAGGRIAEHQRASRPEIELLAWIRTHVPEQSVIGTLNFEIVALIPAMGPNFSYVPMEMRTVTPTGEIGDRCYDLALLLTTSPDDFYRQRFACGGRQRPYSEDVLYSQTHGSPSGRPAYRLDYVIDRSGKPLPPRIAASFPKAAIIHTNQRYQLIQLAGR